MTIIELNIAGLQLSWRRDCRALLRNVKSTHWRMAHDRDAPRAA
jgi:hypothetical protein